MRYRYAAFVLTGTTGDGGTSHMMFRQRYPDERITLFETFDAAREYLLNATGDEQGLLFELIGEVASVPTYKDYRTGEDTIIADRAALEAEKERGT